LVSNVHNDSKNELGNPLKSIPCHQDEKPEKKNEKRLQTVESSVSSFFSFLSEKKSRIITKPRPQGQRSNVVLSFFFCMRMPIFFSRLVNKKKVRQSADR